MHDPRPFGFLLVSSFVWLVAVGFPTAAAATAQEPPAGEEGSSRRAARDAAAVADSQNAAGARSDVLALADRGERELASGDARAALASFERAAAELGKLLLYQQADPDAWGDAGRRVAAGLAGAYLQVDEPYLARVEALRALNLDPRDAPLQAVLGASYYREGRFAQAAAAFAEALRLDPALGAAHAGQALLDLSANRLASARGRFERAYALDGSPQHLWYLARIAFLEHDYEAAAKRLRSYLEHAEGLSRDRRDEARERARVYARLKDGRGSRFATRVTRGQLRFDVARGDEVPLLPVRLNGHDPVYLILDSGAQDHVLDLSFARELGLELSNSAGSVESHLARVERRLAVVDSLNMGGIVVRDVPFSVADLAALGLQGRRSYYVAGVLNPALLFRDFLVRVDFQRRTIELERYETGGRDYLERRPNLRRVVVPFRFNADGTGILVEAELGGSPGHTMLVDTGASDIYLSAAAARILDVDPLDVRVALGEQRRTKLRAHFLREMSDGDDGLPGGGVDYEGILGFPFFRDLRVVFDYYHARLLIES